MVRTLKLAGGIHARTFEKATGHLVSSQKVGCGHVTTRSRAAITLLVGKLQDGRHNSQCLVTLSAILKSINPPPLGSFFSFFDVYLPHLGSPINLCFIKELQIG